MKIDIPIVICGAGKNGLCALHYIQFYYQKAEIVFSDKDERKWGGTLDGKKILSLDKIKDTYGENVTYVLTGGFAREIAEELTVRGVEKKRIKIYKPDVSRIGEKEYSFVIPNEFLNNRKKRIVYSFGIGEDLSFSQEILYDDNINVYAFDPTPKSVKYVKKHVLMDSSRFSFQSIGISVSDKLERFYLPKNDEYVSASVFAHDGTDPNKSIMVEMKKYNSIVRELGHNKVDLVKLDVEGVEFDVMPDIISSEFAPDYICAELHERFFEYPQRKYADLIKDVINKGYRDVYVEGDEILISKKDLMKESINDY